MELEFVDKEYSFIELVKILIKPVFRQFYSANQQV